ncbi:MAG: M56 family metallopeptidase, partial [Tepidisphaeraceae bacterium]
DVIRATTTTPGLAPRGLSAAAWILTAWLSGAVAFAAIGVVRYRAARHRVEAQSTKPPMESAGLFDELRVIFGVRRDVEFRVTHDALGPALLGVVRPLLVVPTSAVEHDAARLRAILAHELIHLRRGDSWVTMVQWIARCVWWFNPLVWWMNREIDRTRELSCDEGVIATLGCAPAGYAQMLLDVLRLRRAARPVAFSLGVSGVQVTSERLRRIMSDTPRFTRRTPAAYWALLLACALLVLPGARLTRENTVAAQPKPTSPVATQPVKPGEAQHYSGVLLDKSTGKPIEGATITVHRLTSRKPGPMRKFAEASRHKTDAQGRFAFDVPPEQAAEDLLYLELDASHPDYVGFNGTGYSHSMIVKNRSLGEEPFFSKLELNPGEEVTGVIHDPGGKPLADVPVRFVSIIRTEHPFLASPPDWAGGEVKTDQTGRFRFNAIKGGGMLGIWASPKEYAVLHAPLNEKRGDVGTLTVEPGVRLTGRLLDAEGKPLAKLRVEAESDDRGTYNRSIGERHAWTNEQGTYTLDPLKSGAYTLRVSGRQPRTDGGVAPEIPMTSAFLPTPLTIAPQQGAAQTFDVRAVPHAIVRLQYVNSAGKPRGGHDQLLNGMYNGKFHSAIGRANETGRVEWIIPKGLEKVEVTLSTNEHSALRRRRGDGLIENNHNGQFELGTVNGDVTDLIAIRYDAPVLVVRIVGPDGKPSSVMPLVKYPSGTVKMRGLWTNGYQGDVWLEKQDGSWRSVNLLPDQEFTLSAQAEGAERSEQKLKLPEGEVREVMVTLKPAPPGPATRP